MRLLRCKGIVIVVISVVVTTIGKEMTCLGSSGPVQGVHGLGGRMATRMIDPQPLVFDHAAQFFTASDPRFQKLVDRWLEKGLVCEWKGLLGELEAGGRFTLIPSSTARYIGMKGMRSLADSIICQVRSFSLFSWICAKDTVMSFLWI